MSAPCTFHEFFQSSFTTDRAPEDYQVRLATDPLASRLINIPTGLGKTAAVIHAWLWNRIQNRREDWPRRLVYCLPMRTLVEQTNASTQEWLDAHGLLWDGCMETHKDKVGLHMLMGGESTSQWDLHPEADAILIGTQDMLLSRALNRGYGMSRFRWPMHYGLLNNDCLWVFDEVQLMGAGLPTTAQLEAFRANFGSAKPCHSWWMSATNAPAWLNTVDFDPGVLATPVQLEEPYSKRVRSIREAPKKVSRCQHASANDKDAKKLCADIIFTARAQGGLTLVVVNTVKRAKQLNTEINKQQAKSSEIPVPTVLLHSHFRPDDRKTQLDHLLRAESNGTPLIAISTQIVEAGVDISSKTLYTEMAPWSSLVQRFGRCNRRGTETDANIFLVTPEKSAPYEEAHVSEASKLIDRLIASGANASPENLSKITIPDCDKPASNHIIRRRDFLDLFDTTPDLAGHDIDIDRWVREIEDTGIQLFWRVWEGSDKNRRPPGGDDCSAPLNNELCPAPIKETRDWIEKRKFTPFRWDHLEREWRPVTREYGKLLLIPGQTYLIPAHVGGYSALTGFDPGITASVIPVSSQDEKQPNEANESDNASEGSWQSIAEHTDHVCHELHTILTDTGVSSPALSIAARWHDLGKAHTAFESKIKENFLNSPEATAHTPVAKAPREAWRPYNDASAPGLRRHFRHELASALAVLQPGTPIPDEWRDLVAWLVAAHHGKVRLSIRSLPDETPPDDSSKRFARGVWDGDVLGPVNLGGGITSPVLTLSLEPMEIGLCVEPPFTDLPSWAERMLALRDSQEIGPLRLAFWESLLRAADARASIKHP